MTVIKLSKCCLGMHTTCFLFPPDTTCRKRFYVSNKVTVLKSTKQASTFTTYNMFIKVVKAFFQTSFVIISSVFVHLPLLICCSLVSIS